MEGTTRTRGRATGSATRIKRRTTTRIWATGSSMRPRGQIPRKSGTTMGGSRCRMKTRRARKAPSRTLPKEAQVRISDLPPIKVRVPKSTRPIKTTRHQKMISSKILEALTRTSTSRRHQITTIRIQATRRPVNPISQARTKVSKAQRVCLKLTHSSSIKTNLVNLRRSKMKDLPAAWLRMTQAISANQQAKTNMKKSKKQSKSSIR